MSDADGHPFPQERQAGRLAGRASELADVHLYAGAGRLLCVLQEPPGSFLVHVGFAAIAAHPRGNPLKTRVMAARSRVTVVRPGLVCPILRTTQVMAFSS